MIFLAATLFLAQPSYHQFAKDVCSERDSLHSERACLAAWRAEQGYPPGDVRCTRRYQIATRWQFIADDAPNCPNLRRPRR